MRQKCAIWAILAAALVLGASHAFADTTPVVTAKEAALMAKNFVAFNATGHFPEWQAASRFSARRVFSTDGIIVAYEVSVRSEEAEKLGFVVVAAQKGNGEVVTAFSSSGETESENIERYYNAVIKPALEKAAVKPTRTSLIGSSTGAYAIGVKLDRKSPALRDVPAQGSYYLFSPNPGMATISFSYKDNQGSRGISPADAEYGEELELREALLTGDFSSSLFHEESSASIEGLERATGSVSGSFSSFFQENRAWAYGGLTSGKCYAGCTPVAWAILLEYWDRKGYPKLISTATDNSNTLTTDPDVRWTIDELRRWLKTTCDASGQGGTSYWNSTRGVYYAQGRGYSSSSASNTIIWSSWWDLLSAVNSGKPPIASLDTNADRVHDHSTVVYSYVDNTGTATDTFCIRTGWSSPTTKCYGQSALYGLTTIIIK